MNRTTLDALSAFVRVIERGSFVAAAADLGVTASAVSKIVTRLEDRLGVRLLHRTTRRLALTMEGELLVAHGRNILQALDAAEAEVTAARGRPAGTLRVAVGSAFAKHRLAPLLPGFRATYPAISLDLVVGDERVDVVAERIDVAIRTGPLADSALVARRLGEGRRVICASVDYLARRGTPTSPADLAEHDGLVLAGFSQLAAWPLHRAGRVVRQTVPAIMVTDSADLLRELVLQGLGIARLADFLVADALADGRLVELLKAHHADDGFAIHAVMPAGRQRVPRVRAFVDHLAKAWYGPRPVAAPSVPSDARLASSLGR